MDDKLKMSKDEARSLWDEISANGLELETSERDFVECAYRIASDLDTPNIRHVLSEPWEFGRKQHDQQAVGFWRQLWPEFTQALRAEVEPALAAA